MQSTELSLDPSTDAQVIILSEQGEEALLMQHVERKTVREDLSFLNLSCCADILVTNSTQST